MFKLTLRLILTLIVSKTYASVIATGGGMFTLNEEKLSLYDIKYHLENIAIKSPLMQIQGTNIIFSGISGKPALLISQNQNLATIQAKKITYQRDNNLVTLSGDVIIISDGSMLKSGEIVYDLSKDELVANSSNEQIEISLKV